MDMEHIERLVRVETKTDAQTKILVQICRDVKAIRANEIKNEARFVKMETDMKWTKGIASAITVFLHGLHFWK